MDKSAWWHQPMRVIQDNLQVKDTPLMDPETIARETEEMHANTLVVNVGGIYAWYPSRVRYHHVNEYLPKDYDLLARLIEECHKRNIRLVARFDFSKTDDFVMQEMPEWFVREPDGAPRPYGALRPGDWSILYATCINGGYRNDELAVPVIREVLENYQIDGIFLNAPHYEYCCCDACRQKYEKLYGKPLPLSDEKVVENTTYGHKNPPADMDPRFPGQCYHDNIDVLYKAIKDVAPQVPLILYYGLYSEKLDDRLATADMICTEAQDVLSKGWKSIPPAWLPTVNMKMGRTAYDGDCDKPFGIIHSCPGMDWRHTGLPQAEYQSWLRQIPAAGGSIWHSITGFNATVSDKRIIKAAGEVDAEIAKVEGDMDGAKDYSDVLLLWDSEKSVGFDRDMSNGWLEMLTDTQTLFDIRSPYQLTAEVLARYGLVVLPNKFPMTDAIVAMLHTYVENGGRLVVEGTSAKQLRPFADVLGIKDSITSSEALTASYWQFEPAGDCIRAGFEETPILAHRGETAYTRALPNTSVLATLIPPFAPISAVGSPPERASMLVKHTDLPLCTLNQYGKGQAVMLSFAIADCLEDYRLAEYCQLWVNIERMLLGKTQKLLMTPYKGIYANAYTGKGTVLLHLVNAVGQRPLMVNTPVADLTMTIRLPEGKHAANVSRTLEDGDVTWQEQDGAVQLTLPKLTLWEMVKITLK